MLGASDEYQGPREQKRSQPTRLQAGLRLASSKESQMGVRGPVRVFGVAEAIAESIINNELFLSIIDFAPEGVIICYRTRPYR